MFTPTIEPVVQTTVRLPEQLHIAVKVIAAKERITLNELFIEAIKAHAEKK